MDKKNNYWDPPDLKDPPDWNDDEWGARLPWTHINYYGLIEHHWQTSFEWEKRYLSILKTLGARYKIEDVIDLGACTGAISTLLAATLNLDRIICVEPDTTNWNMMRYSADMVNATYGTKIAAVNKAVYYCDQEFMKMHSIKTNDNYFNPGGRFLEDVAKIKNKETIESPDTLPVNIVTLEELAKQLDFHHADLVKIDVEGAEWNIIENSEFLKQKTGIIFLEYHDKSLEETIEFLEEHLQNHDILSSEENSIILKHRKFFGGDVGQSLGKKELK
jgi:FkbM family methyltransferase